MKVTGFSFIKNAIKYQYPVVEALQSILPLCDEIVVAVGDSEDDTRSLVSSIDPKIRIIDTTWNTELREDGKALADETNKAFRAIDNNADWCFYIQGDEVVHENDYNEIQKAMHAYKDQKNVDGLLFKYRHFYGSFDYIGVSSKWYKREIRIIKNDKSIFSYRDAQGFRKANNQKLNVKPLNAYIHHYGWVREPEKMSRKQTDFGKLWGGAEWQPPKVYEAFDYKEQIDALQKFKGTHPKVMQQRIANMNWQFDYDISYNKLHIKEKFKNLVEQITGRRPFDHNNYKIV
ncbi:MAG TPA: glycosyltransferase family 2 protein [Flavisolibacter sp.]|nr:glycosyltransferase family 2 protein [Flavisolibacter sp.]